MQAEFGDEMPQDIVELRSNRDAHKQRVQLILTAETPRDLKVLQSNLRKIVHTVDILKKPVDVMTKFLARKEGLVKYIQAYAAASKTGNAVPEGSMGDALARHIDSLTLRKT